MNKKRKRIIFIIAIILFFLIIILFNINTAEEQNKIVEVTEETAEVSTQSIITTLTASGEVQSANTEKITLNTSYYFLTMCAEQDEFVKKGENILKYTNGKYVQAPYDCVIINYSVPKAKNICTSSNYISISSVEDLYMDINVGEDKIKKIITGQEVSIVVNYDETKEYVGAISKINDVGSYSSGGTKFSAIASLKNDGNLKLGMSATCTITTDKKDNLLCLPIEAIQIEDDKKYVNLINEDGLTSQVEVETGVADANYVEIVSGLSLGDKVKYEKTTVTAIQNEEEESENALTSLFNFGGGRESKGNNPNRGGF